MTTLFGFFVALAISVKQKDSSAVRCKEVRCTWEYTNDSAASQLKARGRASLKFHRDGLWSTLCFARSGFRFCWSQDSQVLL